MCLKVSSMTIKVLLLLGFLTILFSSCEDENKNLDSKIVKNDPPLPPFVNPYAISGQLHNELLELSTEYFQNNSTIPPLVPLRSWQYDSLMIEGVKYAFENHESTENLNLTFQQCSTFYYNIVEIDNFWTNQNKLDLDSYVNPLLDSLNNIATSRDYEFVDRIFNAINECSSNEQLSYSEAADNLFDSLNNIENEISNISWNLETEGASLVLISIAKNSLNYWHNLRMNSTNNIKKNKFVLLARNPSAKDLATVGTDCGAALLTVSKYTGSGAAIGGVVGGPVGAIVGGLTGAAACGATAFLASAGVNSFWDEISNTLDSWGNIF